MEHISGASFPTFVLGYGTLSTFICPEENQNKGTISVGISSLQLRRWRRSNGGSCGLGSNLTLIQEGRAFWFILLCKGLSDSRHRNNSTIIMPIALPMAVYRVVGNVIVWSTGCWAVPLDPLQTHWYLTVQTNMVAYEVWTIDSKSEVRFDLQGCSGLWEPILVICENFRL